MATLRGDPVDRPPVNFYEINGAEDVSEADPFNIYSDPSWQPLLELAREKTDRIVMHNLPFKRSAGIVGDWQPLPELEGSTRRTYDERGSELIAGVISAGGRLLTQRTRRDRDINTVWTVEHLLKDADDLRAWLTLPETPTTLEVDAARIIEAERRLGESGIVMLDTGDPLGMVAPLFDMGTYTVIAMTEPELFRRALDRMARRLYPQVEAVAMALPGRLWRIWGPEYASPPYLPPRLFHDYATEYVRPMVKIIHRHGGYARLHSHGRLMAVLDEICATGCDGLDPIEPPPQGDVELRHVRERYGRQLVLFGNLEISDIENLPVKEFERKVVKALREGTAGRGRGFVLQPSACPYGRALSAATVRNYEAMLACVERFAG